MNVNVGKEEASDDDEFYILRGIQVEDCDELIEDGNGWIDDWTRFLDIKKKMKENAKARQKFFHFSGFKICKFVKWK